MFHKALFLHLFFGLFMLAGCNENKELIQLNAQTTKVEALSFTDISLCKPMDKKHDPFFKPYVLEPYQYSAHYSCFNGKCNLNITKSTDNNYPLSVDLYLKSDSGKCTRTTMSTQGHISFSHYKSIVDVPRDMYFQLRIEEDTTNIQSKKGEYQGYSRSIDATNLEFHYNTIPKFDIISINMIDKIKIVF